MATTLQSTLYDINDALADVTLGSKSWSDVWESASASIVGGLGDVLKSMGKQLAGVALFKALAGAFLRVDQS